MQEVEKDFSKKREYKAAATVSFFDPSGFFSSNPLTIALDCVKIHEYSKQNKPIRRVISPYGEYTHALRLISELVDLRARYAKRS